MLSSICFAYLALEDMLPSIHMWTCGQVFPKNAESGHEVALIRTNSSTLTSCVRMEALSSWSWRPWSSSLIAIIIHHGHPLHRHRIIITTQQSNNSQSTRQLANQSINTSQNQSISPIISQRQATSINSVNINIGWSKSFIRERPFFANKNVSFAKLSRTLCLCSRIFYRPTNSTFLLHVILNLLGWGWGGVGWGMLTFACTCVMKLMLRHAWGWGWVGSGGAC